MNCPNCNQQLPDDALFCGNCGTRVEASQQNTNYQNDQTAYQQPNQNPYQQPYQHPYQQAYQQPAQSPTRQESPTLSTWALLCSIIFNPIVGIILGIIGIKVTPSYKGKCIAAIVIGAVMLVLTIISYAVIMPIYFEMLAELGAM